MDLTGVARHLDGLDATTWNSLVRAAVSDEDAEMISHTVEPIFIGIGTGTRLYRVLGTARTRQSAPVDWSLVIKVFTTEHLDFQSVSDDESAWDYWRREWLVYRSPWLAQLDGPLRAPQCLATGEITDGPDPVLWVALEDLGDLPHRWPLAEFGEVAYTLGQFGGRFLAGAPLPDEAWLSRRWLVGWTEQAAATIDLLPAAAAHPDAGRVFPAEVGAAFRALWDRRLAVYAALDGLPTTFTHNDVFPRNLRRRTTTGTASNVAVDWAYCGLAPVGAELAPLVGATIAFFGSTPTEWGDLERLSLEAYLRGLRDAGWHGSADEVRFGYQACFVLRYGLGPLTPIMGVTMSEEGRDLVSPVFGCSFEEFLANGAAMTRFQCDRIPEVLVTAGA